MKKNISLLIGVGLFVLLFYKEDIGINLPLFTALVWLLFFSGTTQDQRSLVFRQLSALLILSNFSFAWYGDLSSFLAVFATFFLLGCKTYYPGLNILLTPFSAGLNFASFFFRAPFLPGWLPLKGAFSGNFYKKFLYYFMIPAILIFLFLLMYSFSSDLFSSFFVINWNLDFLQILFLIAGGFFFLFSFFHFWIPDVLLKYNARLSDNFSSGVEVDKSRFIPANDIRFYRKSGEISLLFLNAIVLFFIITYCMEQFSKVGTCASVSQELHERVYMLIFSIVMAIAVIMAFFKGILNFDNQAVFLKKMATVWIFLNAALLIVVAMKNIEYIQLYGLTFKRMGVFLFLLLSITGLVFTFLKIKNKKTNTYLVNRMVWALYFTLILLSTINWSWITTRFNLNHSNTFDVVYARSLPFNKQLLYNERIINETELDTIKKMYSNKPFLSQTMYYNFLQVK